MRRAVRSLESRLSGRYPLGTYNRLLSEMATVRQVGAVPKANRQFGRHVEWSPLHWMHSIDEATPSGVSRLGLGRSLNNGLQN
jgi:hypothetical protein